MNTLEHIYDFFDSAVTIEISDGSQNKILGETDRNVLQTLKETFRNGREMPAFGVSLDRETKKQMQNNVWIQLKFDEAFTFREMPFEGLLIFVHPLDRGVNLIRLNHGKYEGRCYYVDLQGNMKDLYESILASLTQNTITAKND